MFYNFIYFLLSLLLCLPCLVVIPSPLEIVVGKHTTTHTAWVYVCCLVVALINLPHTQTTVQGLETIREGRRSFIGTTSTPTVSTTAPHHQRPSNVPGMGSSMNRTSMTSSMPSPVKMRENKAPRKQRPASVASSMPSFVGGEPAKSPRSKSTDRTGRGR